MFLLDTEVVWQLRGAGATDPTVAAWAARQPRTNLFISAMALVELGVAAREAERVDKLAAAAIQLWAQGVLTTAFAGRIIALDATVAARAARLAHPNLTDGLLAASALEHGLVLATLSPASFKATKVRLLDPRHEGATDAIFDDTDWRQASRNGPVWLRNLFARG